MPSYSEIVRHGVYWSYFRSALAWIVMLPTAIILARLLTPAEFGVAAAATFFIQLSNRLTRAGLNMALIRAKEITQDHISTTFVFYLAISITTYLGLVVFAPLIGKFFNSPDVGLVLPLAGLAFLLSAFAAVPLALLRRDMRFRDIATLQSTGLILQSIGAVILVWMGMSFWGILWGNLAGSFAQTVMTMYYARWRPRFAFSSTAFRELSSFGFGSYVVKVLEYGALNVDNLIIGRLLGIVALGYYDRAFTLMDRVVDRLNAAGPSVSFKVFALINEDPERFRRAWRKLTMTVALVGYPILVWLCVAAPELFAVLFGPQWTPSVLPFQFLCVAGMLKLVNEYASAASQAHGWVWAEAARQVLYTLLIVGAVFALRSFGLVGAAGGVLAATMVMTLLMASLLRSATPLGWRDIVEPQLPGIYCSVILAVTLMLVKTGARWITGDHTASLTLLVAEAIIGGVLFLACIWFNPSEGVRSVVRDVLGDVSPRLAASFPVVTRSARI